MYHQGPVDTNCLNMFYSALKSNEHHKDQSLDSQQQVAGFLTLVISLVDQLEAGLLRCSDLSGPCCLRADTISSHQRVLPDLRRAQTMTVSLLPGPRDEYVPCEDQDNSTRASHLITA
ncbi:hypothetical protein RRG08_027853 [Elysia crispata]|uniref:Uncharacterized protein n=1 Tax=Elysia crispata TaxID=231223 RepID=A0AAE0YTQ3_9GAST|nr:hypothetical protein RRG08_027853 [Elysia crispata]